jgi:xanthine dehydrogenase accessory factor
MKQLSTWQFILSNLEKGWGVMLLYVLESKGSSPGRKGFFMAVNAAHEMHGSIGGGIMEHKFVELAKEKFRQTDKNNLLKKQVHSKTASANQSGMICSGEQTLLIYFINENDVAAIQNIISCLEENRNGTLKLLPDGIYYSDATNSISSIFDYTNDDVWEYTEYLGYQNHLYIVGGGHCALAFSRLMRTMDFYIHLLEDRHELNTFIHNDAAHEKILVKDYSELDQFIPSGSNNYVVLMTFGYRSDAIALRALINKDLKYLGMLGSKAKIKQLFAEFKQEGIEADKIAKVHAPIGIDIKSQTPEEIAVSIAAEIIRVKNDNL